MTITDITRTRQMHCLLKNMHANGSNQLFGYLFSLHLFLPCHLLTFDCPLLTSDCHPLTPCLPCHRQRQVRPIGILQLSEHQEEDGHGRSESGVTLDVVDL